MLHISPPQFYVFMWITSRGRDGGTRRQASGFRAQAGQARAHLATLLEAGADAREALREVGCDPRAFLARVMNQKNLPIDKRMRAAEILMPFILPKLSASAVVSQRIEGNDPAAIIRALNDRIERVTASATIEGQAAPEAIAA